MLEVPGFVTCVVRGGEAVGVILSKDTELAKVRSGEVFQQAREGQALWLETAARAFIKARLVYWRGLGAR